MYALQLDEIAQAQILELCCQEFARDAHIRIMPDAHAGAGCVIGTTMAVSDRIAPSLVGVDIGCGMEAVKLSDMEADLPRLDEVVRTRVPSGFTVRARPHPFMKDVKNGFLKDLRCAGLVGLDRAQLDVGTLGGGNHFIELDRADGGGLWLVVHSGSRHTGLVVSEIYRRLAKAYCAGVPEGTLLDLFLSYASGSAKRDNLAKLTEALTAAERTAERRHGRSVPADLSYLEGQLMSFYLQDMELMTRYADLNRRAIATEILEGMGLTDSVCDRFCTVHNFISRSDRVLRKGAVPAPAGERFLLPMNMRDGGLICIGKGKPRVELFRAARRGAHHEPGRREAHIVALGLHGGDGGYLHNLRLAGDAGRGPGCLQADGLHPRRHRAHRRGRRQAPVRLQLQSGRQINGSTESSCRDKSPS